MTKDYLQKGQQTSITPQIKEISQTLQGENLDYVSNALIWLHKNINKAIPDDIEKNDVFRKRTADQIISDKYFSGCTDYALVFIVLCRAKGLETKYVEAIKTSWLEEGGNSIQGHIFAECLIGDRWIQIDPQRATIHPLMNYNGFEIYEKGLDSWDLGIDSFNSLKNKFEEFRMQYLTGKSTQQMPADGQRRS